MLTIVEGRVLGCLMEKERTVPDQYPLSLNAALLACNQSTAREPVMALAEHEVEAALTSLKSLGFVRFVHPTSGRGVTKYRQVFDEKQLLEPEDTAALAILLLRGPQTVSEIRTRAERMHGYESLETVERVLGALSRRDTPMAERLERQPGQSQVRWRQLIAEEPEYVAPVAHRSEAVRAPASAELDALRARVDDLEARLAILEELLR